MSNLDQIYVGKEENAENVYTSSMLDDCSLKGGTLLDCLCVHPSLDPCLQSFQSSSFSFQGPSMLCLACFSLSLYSLLLISIILIFKHSFLFHCHQSILCFIHQTLLYSSVHLITRMVESSVICIQANQAFTDISMACQDRSLWNPSSNKFLIYNSTINYHSLFYIYIAIPKPPQSISLDSNVTVDSRNQTLCMY